MNRNKRLQLALIFLLIFSSANAFAQTRLKMGRISSIESSNNSKAYNRKSGARGLYQITEICLKDYNQFHKVKYTSQDLFIPEINEKIARWYLEKRIPQMLRYYNIPVTTDNILWAYNAGIGKVVKGVMPDETKDYIKKYNESKI